MIGQLEKLQMRMNSVNSQPRAGNSNSDWLTPNIPQCPSSTVPGFPRSAFEAVHDDSNKFRQLPCRTHISVGVCPYREKCVFLHDPRCVCPTAKSITRLKNKNRDDCVADSLYWPAMPQSMVLQHLDTANRPKPHNPYEPHGGENEQQPHVVQPYCVPIPQADQYHLHDSAVYSMWMHFIDFCLASANSTATTTSAASTYAYSHHRTVPNDAADTALCYAAVDVTINPYSRRPRLPVFQHLSKSMSLAPLPENQLRLRAAAAPPAHPSAVQNSNSILGGSNGLLAPPHSQSTSRILGLTSAAPVPSVTTQSALDLFPGKRDPLFGGSSKVISPSNGSIGNGIIGARNPSLFPVTQQQPLKMDSLLAVLQTSPLSTSSTVSPPATLPPLLTSSSLLESVTSGSTVASVASASAAGCRQIRRNSSPVSVQDGATSLETSSNSSDCDAFAAHHVGSGLLGGLNVADLDTAILKANSSTAQSIYW